MVPSVPTASALNWDWGSTLPCLLRLRHDCHQKSLPEAWFLPPHPSPALIPPKLQGSHYSHKWASSCSFHLLYPYNIFLLMTVFSVVYNNLCFPFPSRHKLLKDKGCVFPALYCPQSLGLSLHWHLMSIYYVLGIEDTVLGQIQTLSSWSLQSRMCSKFSLDK